MKKPEPQELTRADEQRMLRPNWKRKCENCGQKPIVPMSGLCGPCHFGTADAVNGGWWNDKMDAFDDDFADEHLPEAR